MVVFGDVEFGERCEMRQPRTRFCGRTQSTRQVEREEGGCERDGNLVRKGHDGEVGETEGGERGERCERMKVFVLHTSTVV